MNKIKCWPTLGKDPVLILIFLCFLMVMVMVIGIFLVWNSLWGNIVKEGLFVSINDKTVSDLDRAVDTEKLSKLNDVPNSGDPIVFSSNPIVAEYDGPDPEFPIEGSVLKCSKDDINGNGSYYLVSNTNPKTINLFPNEDRTIINSWSDSWGSAPSFKNCSAFVRGPTMKRQIPLPKVGTDIRCKNEESQANRHTYRVMTRTKIQPFPGYEEDPNQVVAKSWGVNEIDLEPVDDCSNINRVRDNKGNVKKFKYKVNMGEIEGQLVRCRQSAVGSKTKPPGDHGTDEVYKVENKKLRWYQNVAKAYTSFQNIVSWGLSGNTVVDVPSCDDIELGANIRYNARKLPDGTYTKCAIDVPGGVGTDKVYRVVGNNGDLSWTVSDEIARFFDPNFNTAPNAYGTYPDCSSFKRGEDISKKIYFYRDYNTPGTHNFTIPPGCIGIHAITVGGGGGGGGGSGGWYKRKDKGKDNGQDGGGGAGGGGGGGAVRFSNGTYIPINDSNRNSGFIAHVGRGGAGGRKGDHNQNNNISGGEGGLSYFGIGKKMYFQADGGVPGEKGEFAKNYRGQNGNGGRGGGISGTSDSIGYKGTPGQTVKYDNNPYHNVDGGNGGRPENIPGNLPGIGNIGLGGNGGRGSDKAYDGATAGNGGTNGFVRIIFVF